VIQAIRSVKRGLALVMAGGKPMGTGFFVGPGQVLTCAHVVTLSGAPLSVSTCFGESGAASVLRTDEDLDVALLRTGAAANPVDLAERNKNPGTEVGFMGMPFPGLFNPPMVMTHRSIIGSRYDLSGVEHYVVDAVIGEGYSGSPVFLMNGEVCGMIASRFDPLRVSDNWTGAPVSSLTFAVTSRRITAWLHGESLE